MSSWSKKYDGYRSFQYLEAGRDYKDFELVPQIGRVAEYKVPVTPEQEKRVEAIIRDNLVISLHDHCFVAPKNLNEFWEWRRQGRDWTGYEGLAHSGMDAVFDNMMNGTAMITSKWGWKWDDIIYDIGMRLSDIAHQDLVKLALTTEDIRNAKANGQVAFIVSLEGAAMIENELDRIDILYGLGVRALGIAYSEGNSLGAGLREPNDGGLTVFGRQAVKRMNQLGIAIDVSHSGDRTALDTIEYSEKPIFITHAGARALWDSRRLKPDDVIKACAEKGGVIGIEAAPHTTITRANRRHNIDAFMEHFEYCVDLVGIDHIAFGPDLLFGDHVGIHDALSEALSIGIEAAPHTTITRANRRHNIDAFMEHFEYCVDLVGIDHVAFGPDLLFGDHVGIHDALSEALSIGASKSAEEFPKVEWVEGLENPTEAFPNIIRWMVGKGYSDEDIAKAVGGNIMRVLGEVWHK